MFNTDESVEKLRKDISHRTPDPRSIAVLRDLRQRFLDLSVAVDGLLPPSRERSLVITKLDEARMWACNAAVVGGEIREELVINRPLPPPAVAGS